MDRRWQTWIRTVGIATLMLSMVLVPTLQAWACDVAVVSGRVTTNGRPLIWKNRDCSANWHQEIKYFEAKYPTPGGYLMVYNFDDLANLNNGTPVNPSGGINKAGFAISCTSVYEDYNQFHEAINVNTDLIRQSLQECSTLAQFEQLLNVWHLTHWGAVISGNFVAIDAQGGAALYECYTGNEGGAGTPIMFRKYDANNGRVIDEKGTVIKPGEGDNFCGFWNLANCNSYITINFGEERRWRATDILTELAKAKNLNYTTVMRYVAKDVTGDQSNNTGSTDEHYSTTYCISRNATRLAMVVDGVPAGGDPRQSVFWCALGEPSIAVFLPFFAHAEGVSDLTWVDAIGLDGTQYDLNDTCLLNRAFNRREIFDKRIYKSNTGSALTGMDNRLINKVELAKAQKWIFPLEDDVIAHAALFMNTLKNKPSLITKQNLRNFSDYCVQWTFDNYDNYNETVPYFVPWSFVLPQ